jgi:Cdc6-like AAA superfamily ATPase
MSRLIAITGRRGMGKTAEARRHGSKKEKAS